jgi:hypothetical protein
MIVQRSASPLMRPPPRAPRAAVVATHVRPETHALPDADRATALACMSTGDEHATADAAYAAGRERLQRLTMAADGRPDHEVLGVRYLRAVSHLQRSVLKVVCARRRADPACPGAACPGLRCPAHHEVTLLRRLAPDGPVCVPIAWHTFPSGSVVLLPRASMDLEQWQAAGRAIDRRLMRLVAAGSIEAIQHMHDRDIVHSDVKRENVLLWLDDAGAVQRMRLCDLDLADDVAPLARAAESGAATPDPDYWNARCGNGSLGFMDPCCVVIARHLPDVRPRVLLHALRQRDYWGVAMMMFCLFTNARPYARDDLERAVMDARDVQAALAAIRVGTRDMRRNFDLLIVEHSLDADDALAASRLIFGALEATVLAGESRLEPLLVGFVEF